MKRLMFALVVSLLSGGVFATEYFVDASRPDDSGDGKSEKTAKRTLNGALSLSGLADGDIVTVLPGVTIGDNVVVGAGSLVTRDIPDNTLAYGHPCRPIRSIS